MTNAVLSAQLPPRELALLAVMNGLVDWTPAEVSRYAILRTIGRSHDEAQELARKSNKTIRDNITSMQGTEDAVTSVQIQREWLEAAKELHPELSASAIFRYAVLRLSGNDDETAMREAQRSHGGGWTKGKSRKS